MSGLRPKPPELCALLSRFGQAAFRPGQQRAIELVCAGRDVIVRMPTGSGKSLCYQLAALALRARGAGPTWVVSPLTALMNDQAASLSARGIRAIAWHSALGVRQANAAHEALRMGSYDLLFLSPERASQPSQLALARAQHIALLAIDEAHCISQWGHDFRPEYRLLGLLRQQVAGPTMALSATLSEESEADVVRSLKLICPARVAEPMGRGNLAFSVAGPMPLKERLALLPGFVRASEQAGATLVYVSTRSAVTAATTALRDAGVEAPGYHAGLGCSERLALEQAFLDGRVGTMVATCAFGMGLDRPDVRRVLHLQAPARLEALYQEAGRAGRDGALSAATLWWGRQDWLVHRQMASRLSGRGQRAAEAGLLAMQAYVATPECRQQQMLAHLGRAEEQGSRCGLCDACVGVVRPVAERRAPRAPLPLPPEEAERVDGALVRLMAVVRRPLGRRLLAQAARGSVNPTIERRGLTRLPGAGQASAATLAQIELRIERLLRAGTLVARGRKYPTVWLAGRPQRTNAARPKASEAGRSGPAALALALERFCRQQARALGWPKPYMVLPKEVRRRIVSTLPTTPMELAQLRGMGPRKVERFADAIVALVVAHR